MIFTFSKTRVLDSIIYIPSNNCFYTYSDEHNLGGTMSYKQLFLYYNGMYFKQKLHYFEKNKHYKPYDYFKQKFN